MQPRYKNHARRDLYEVERKIEQHKKTAQNTPKKSTARIADAVLPSLQRQAEALRAEIETLPDDPPRQYRSASHIEEPKRTTPLAPEELEQLEIPAFLRRIDS